MNPFCTTTRDYDCFYASVFEAENPALKFLPLAVQQKQIVVTCNYEARRRGLRKLQLIKEAKKVCPDVVIVLGEDLTKFRDASKELHSFLKRWVWGSRIEKLGFDEVFLDVTPMVDYNAQCLNRNDLQNSFFQLDKSDPTVGFSFDASAFWGPTYPPAACSAIINLEKRLDQLTFSRSLDARLILGSHLANYLRCQLEEHTGYTATVGVSTSKLLAKLVGNVNKPRNQTTLIPPYLTERDGQGSNVASFLDQHEVGKIPGIGFKVASRIRAHVLGRQPNFETYHELENTDKVTVGAVRSFPGMGPSKLDEIFRGGGWPKDIGTKAWDLLNGIDNTEVAVERAVPSQISIEDSYGQVDNLHAVRKELLSLALSLLRRMHADLIHDDKGEEDIMFHRSNRANTDMPIEEKRRWLAHPRTLRLSTRSRLLPLPDGSHQVNANRVSRSCPVPQFIFSFNKNVETLAARLVDNTIIPLFRRLHPDKSGYKLSLINIAVTNMIQCAGPEQNSVGQDIGKMFRDRDNGTMRSLCPVSAHASTKTSNARPNIVNTEPVTPQHWSWDQNEHHSPKDVIDAEAKIVSDDDEIHQWASDDDAGSSNSATPCDECKMCGAHVPRFAAQAHAIYHSVPR
ncbi:DNA polymerase [Emydomyces testavorans]|uniref:DNA polymerase n=1 Tax=Emydomyces testavorans TaxID=2070801 RepID=A0AAF0DNX0_9EURO|nr:DNA polymerase [Emydomyces testavorans]